MNITYQIQTGPRHVCPALGMSFRVKGDLASSLTGTWEIDLVSTPCRAPLAFCRSFCCTPCVTYQQRAEFFDITQEPYVCCGGVCPCPLLDPAVRFSTAVALLRVMLLCHGGNPGKSGPEPNSF